MESFSDWANLPTDLLTSILERLPTSKDYLRFSVVCRSWNSILKHKESKHPPMLLTYTGKEDTWNLCDVANDEVLDLQLKLPTSRFCGSSKRWLITMDVNFIVSLINPFYNVKEKRPQENSIIKLPTLLNNNGPPYIIDDDKTHWTEKHGHYVFKGTISADPISDANNCIVVIIYFPLCQVAFTRLRDKIWTYNDAVPKANLWQSDIRNIDEIVYYKNKFYAVHRFNRLFTFEAPKKNSELNSKDNVIWVTNGELPKEEEWLYKSYLVETSDHNELLVIHRYYYHHGKRCSRKTFKFTIFKSDDDKRNWIEINTLGDAAIFLGDNSSTYISDSTNFGFMPNSIYFTHDQDKQTTCRTLPRDNGVYNMETKILSRIGLHAKAMIKKSKQTPIWTNIKF